VKVGDATDFLKRFGRYRLPVGRQLFDGYDDDPREIYTTTEVQNFYQQIWQRWPY
jgi:hypothetical protein